MGAGRAETLMMAGSAVAYVVFIVSVGTRVQAFILVASAVKGFCSGLLWIGEGGSCAGFVDG